MELELFRDDGCLTDEGLQALLDGQLDELGRLEAAEHLAYCDRCVDRYTALLTGGALEEAPRGMSRPVIQTVWVRVMQNVYGRAAVAGVAAVLAFTLWRSGAMGLILDRGREMEAFLPQSGATPAAEAGPETEAQRPGAVLDRLTNAWNALFGADESKPMR